MFGEIVHIHIVGICGTFMGGIAQLAKSLDIKVSGCDAAVYPPMSDQLKIGRASCRERVLQVV